MNGFKLGTRSVRFWDLIPGSFQLFLIGFINEVIPSQSFPQGVGFAATEAEVQVAAPTLGEFKAFGHPAEFKGHVFHREQVAV